MSKRGEVAREDNRSGLREGRGAAADMTVAKDREPGSRASEAAPRQHQRYPEWVEQWRVAKGDRLKALVAAVREKMTDHMRRTGVYTRRLRTSDQQSADKITEAIVVNLAAMALGGCKGERLALFASNGGRGKSPRYDRLVFGDQWEKQRPALEAIGVLDYRRGLQAAGRGEAPSIAPTAAFAERVRAACVTLHDIGEDDAAPLLILSRTRSVLAEDTQDRGSRLEFTDTEETKSLVAEVSRLNDFLAAADIGFDDDGELPVVDPLRRRLRRHFVLLRGQCEPRFDQGGRLFGGFWMSLRKDRRRHIRIDGEPVAVLDYSGMATRLAYAKIGAAPPDGDPYDLPGFGRPYRQDVKTLLNCLWYDDWDRTRWPKAMREDAAMLERGAVGPGYILTRKTLKETLTAIRSHHPLLARDLFGERRGDELMFMESRILLTSLNELMAAGVVGLGLHDGMLVAESKADMAMQVMERSSLSVSGASIPVRREDHD